MNTLTYKTSYDYTESKPDILEKLSEFIYTTTRIATTSKKEELVNFLKDKRDIIGNLENFNNFIEKLNENEIDVFFKLLKKLINEKRNFRIKIFKTEGNLEEVNFIIYYSKEMPYEKIEKDIFEINEFLEQNLNLNKIGKNSDLWYIGFAGIRV
ncbi:hypothetical protein JCM14244_16680 [Venenivibrio stagnispumantis]|uniref:Uncharacterized protein n=1 Tax=Venenivibrio stagnispumantis TaxID=407998 RepID=A0AA46AG36_9AQUI|nr:hypothetical protein [Venenivibrio stagnispumantis]MCW4573542.1 hypothetical protein [Venenivibrio stagnispumantis]SMP23647.1 hypothetical protein SAMN06264868_1305 [Venenivibrio stagnispumantis]